VKRCREKKKEKLTKETLQLALLENENRNADLEIQMRQKIVNELLMEAQEAEHEFSAEEREQLRKCEEIFKNILKED
jgi:hypothetical protein